MMPLSRGGAALSLCLTKYFEHVMCLGPVPCEYSRKAAHRVTVFKWFCHTVAVVPAASSFSRRMAATWLRHREKKSMWTYEERGELAVQYS